LKTQIGEVAAFLIQLRVECRKILLAVARIDEALFLGGMDKGEFLRAFGADIFFDDQQKQCETARQHVATGHVPHGVANE
jgi:hypothetical protein